MTLPEIDLTTLKAEITDGKETAVPGDTVTVSVKVTDDRGIARVALNQFKPNRDTTGEITMKYNDATGLYECTREITDNTYPGEYSAYYLRAIDTNGNTTWLYYNQNDLSGGSYIVSATTSDNTPPVIDTETLTVDISGDKGFAVLGDAVKVSLSASDDGLGVSRINVGYVKPVSGDILSFRLNYNSETNTWEGAVPFGESVEGGLWKIYSIEALDKGGNLTRVINTAFDNESGIELSAGDFEVKYTVRFDTRGGNEIASQYVLPVEKAIQPEDPTKGEGGGCVFMYWCTDPELTTMYNFNNEVDDNITLYAKWTAAFSVCSYDKTDPSTYMGGMFLAVEEEHYQYYQDRTYEDLYDSYDIYYGGNNYTVEEGTRYVLKAFPDSGYRFLGWYKGTYIGVIDYYHSQVSVPEDLNDPDTLLSTETVFNVTVNDATVICPVFEQLPRYDVTFDANGGSGEMDTLNTYNGYPIPASTFTTPENKHFAGWNTFADGSGTAYEEGDGLELGENITLYAQWEEHFWTEGTTVPATCTSEGTKTLICTCGAEKTESIPSDPNAHSFETVITKATPDSDGQICEKCTLCGTEQSASLLPKANSFKLAATSFTFDGTAKKPAVTVANSAGSVLDASNYTVSYSNNVNAGTATATVTLEGAYYSGTKTLTFTIEKAANPLTVKGKTVKLKASKVKKKKQTIKAVNAFTVGNAQGAVTYKLLSVKKAKFKKYFKVNAKTGTITVKKKLKKGTYTVKVQVTAAGNANYGSAKKVVTVKIKIK